MTHRTLLRALIEDGASKYQMWQTFKSRMSRGEFETLLAQSGISGDMFIRPVVHTISPERKAELQALSLQE